MLPRSPMPWDLVNRANRSVSFHFSPWPQRVVSSRSRELHVGSNKVCSRAFLISKVMGNWLRVGVKHEFETKEQLLLLLFLCATAASEVLKQNEQVQFKSSLFGEHCTELSSFCDNWTGTEWKFNFWANWNENELKISFFFIPKWCSLKEICKRKYEL